MGACGSIDLVTMTAFRLDDDAPVSYAYPDSEENLGGRYDCAGGK